MISFIFFFTLFAKLSLVLDSHPRSSGGCPALNQLVFFFPPFARGRPEVHPVATSQKLFFHPAGTHGDSHPSALVLPCVRKSCFAHKNAKHHLRCWLVWPQYISKKPALVAGRRVHEEHVSRRPAPAGRFIALKELKVNIFVLS